MEKGLARSLEPEYVSRTYKGLTAALKAVLIPGVSLNVTGIENIPADGPYVLAFSHHSSWWDILASGQAVYEQTKRPVRYMAKEDLFRNQVLGSAITALNGIPVSRHEYKPEQVKNAVDHLNTGNVVGVGVEGTRIYGPELAKLKRGVGIIASLANVKIAPVAIRGREHHLRKKRPTITPPLEVVFGEMLEVPNYSGQFDPMELSSDNFPRELLKAAIEVQRELRQGLQIALDEATARSDNPPRQKD
ncbi:MAG: 1-acyl-sn-glycerol-3-phosphate acyltransferase [Candidatus Saccharimonadales bacterium]